MHKPWTMIACPNGCNPSHSDVLCSEHVWW